MRFLASFCNLTSLSACSWYNVLCDGSPTSYIPLGYGTPNRVPCPPAMRSTATFPSAIWRKPEKDRYFNTFPSVCCQNCDMYVYIKCAQLLAPKPFPNQQRQHVKHSRQMSLGFIFLTFALLMFIFFYHKCVAMRVGAKSYQKSWTPHY